MTKKELAKVVAEKNNSIHKDTKISVKNAIDILNCAFDSIIGCIENEESLFIRGFGTFSAKTRKSKPVRNIRKNELFILKEHKIPHFKPCKSFKDLLK